MQRDVNGNAALQSPWLGLCTLLSEMLYGHIQMCVTALCASGQEGIGRHGCRAFRQPHEHSITLHAHPWAARSPLPAPVAEGKQWV